MKYPIVEVFTSIQGEGLYTGAPASFIRLAGCNLACEFCDTDKEAREELTPKEIIERLTSDIRIVVLTGGEPTIHDLTELIKELRKHWYQIHLETNGTHMPPSGTHWTSVSPKKGHGLVHYMFGEAKWLIPVWSYEEIDWDISNHHYLQPVNHATALSWFNVDLCVHLLKKHPRSDLRLSIQLHKVIGVR